MKTTIALVAALTVALPAWASGKHHHDRDDDHEMAPAPQPSPTPPPNNIYISKKRVYVHWGVLVLAGGGIYCGAKRFYYNDPCIGEPVRQTSTADDKVTPDNLSDKPKSNVKLRIER